MEDDRLGDDNAVLCQLSMEDDRLGDVTKRCCVHCQWRMTDWVMSLNGAVSIVNGG